MLFRPGLYLRRLSSRLLNFARLPQKLRVSVLLALLALINYLPAFDYGTYPGVMPQSDNISSAIYIKVFDFPNYLDYFDNQNYNFAWEWYTASNLATGQPGYEWSNDNNAPPLNYYQTKTTPQLPLWRYDARDGGRPLLVISKAPILYPFSLLYYLSGTTALFAAFHLWVGLLGMYLLAGRFAPRLGRWLRPALLLLVLIALPLARPDLEGALAWLPFALWLVLAGSEYRQFVGLTLVCAMILMAVDLPVALVLTGLLILCWVSVQISRRRQQPALFLPDLAKIGLALMLAHMLAAPQVWPRLFDQMQPYQPTTAPYNLVVEPAGSVEVLQAVRLDNNRISYRLRLTQDTETVRLIVPERYDEGWTARYRPEDYYSDYQVASVARVGLGWRSITLWRAFTGRNGVIDLETSYTPRKFQAGLYSAFVALAGLMGGAMWRFRQKLTKIALLICGRAE